MARNKRGKRLRVLAAPFTVAAPTGARIRDRLRVTDTDAETLALVGRHLGHHQRADLARRVGIGKVRIKDNQRAERKRELTAVSSSRWAGTMTRASEDQYQLSLRCLYDEASFLRKAIRTITRRLAVECGTRNGKTRGYRDQGERFEKQRRLQTLTSRLAVVEQRIETGRPSVVVGGRRLAKTRHNLEEAQLTEAQWHQHWDAERLFLTADGESGAPFGNYSITVDPNDGSVAFLLPEPLRHLANAPRGRYRLACTVTFNHRREEWTDRITTNRAVRYDITFAPDRDRWYLDASWSTDTAVLPTPEEIRVFGERMLGIDLNADHLAVCVLDPHGNPIGRPHTVPFDMTGPASRRDGRLREAITRLLTIAKQQHCAAIVVENLDFEDARSTGRERMGRGGRGRKFRRTVAGIPTARFRERLRGMAFHAGLVVIAVDPAYTSLWGEKHWKDPLQRQTKETTVTRHHTAAVAIGRRGLGHRIRRRPGVTPAHQRMSAGRATGQTGSVPRPPGTASPPRTTSAPPRGGKTRQSPGDQLALFPVPGNRSQGTGPSPVYSVMANNGQQR